MLRVYFVRLFSLLLAAAYPFCARILCLSTCLDSRHKTQVSGSPGCFELFWIVVLLISMLSLLSIVVFLRFLKYSIILTVSSCAYIFSKLVMGAGLGLQSFKKGEMKLNPFSTLLWTVRPSNVRRQKESPRFNVKTRCFPIHLPRALFFGFWRKCSLECSILSIE